MTPSLSPADWEWIKSRIDRLGSLAPEARALFLEQGLAERPALAPILESMLDASTRTFQLLPDVLAPPASERHAFAPGEVIAGRYRVCSCVGAGGMGEVYEVEDTHMPERGALALKTVRGDLLPNAAIAARFEREVRHALELAHPNVCRIYDVSRHSATGATGSTPLPSDVLFLTMEFLSGGTLSKWMKDADGRPRAVPQSDALPLIRQMTAGLAVIHGEHLIHRDFKPLNVMLVTSGSDTRAVITDLGLARTVRDGMATEGDTTLTRTGASPGTPAYMAPELIAGTAPASYPADVYSLGVTMLEMLTASRSGTADAAKALKAAGVSAHLTTIVLKCLDRDPVKRYRDASEVAAALNPKLTLPRLPLQRAALVFLGSLIALGSYYWWINRAPSIPEEAKSWYTRGVEDMQSGSYYAAAKKFQEATAMAPDFTMAHVRLAEAWFGLEGHNLANAEMLRAVGKLIHEEQDYREAVRLTLAGEREKAIEAFKAFASHATDAHAAQLALALALERAGRGSEAANIYAGLTSVYPWANLKLAILHARNGDWGKANPEFDGALADFRKANNDEGETEALYQRGFLSLQAARLDDARQLLNQVMVRVQLTHNVYQQIRAEIDLSTVELSSGHSDDAIAVAKQAMQSASDSQVEVMYSRARRGLANAYTYVGEYDKAEPLLQDALRFARQNSDDRLAAGALTLLSDVHNRTGRFADAAAEAEKAFVWYNGQNNPNQAVQSAHAAANAYRDLGQFEKAADLANHALSVATGAKNDGRVGEAQEAAGAVELARERYTDAAVHLRLAVEASTRAKAVANIPNETVQWATALAALGQFAEAGRLFDSAATLAVGRKGLLDVIRIERASMELHRGNPAAAAKLVSGIPRDDSDAWQTVRLALIHDSAQSDSAQVKKSLERAGALLKLDKEGLSFTLRRQLHFAAAMDLSRVRDLTGATAALGPAGDYSEMAELSWRASLLASKLNAGDASAARRRDALAALAASAPYLGYSLANKTPSPRLDIRDELREITITSPEK